MSACDVQLPATAVAEYSKERQRVGTVHRTASNRPAAPMGRNRRHYRVACGRVVREGLPARVAPADDICVSCWGTLLRDGRR